MEDLSGARLYSDVVSYTSSGDHRTGSDGLRAAQQFWLQEMEAAGYTTEEVRVDDVGFS